MQEVAELTDEKQRLEHLVEQLQYETDTIGKVQFTNIYTVNFVTFFKGLDVFTPFFHTPLIFKHSNDSYKQGDAVDF